MRTATDVFTKPFGQPGSSKNSKSVSATHSEKQTQVGGNRLTGAWHPQLTVPKNRKHIATFQARPTQHRDATSGFSGASGQKVPYNTHTRPLAGSHNAGVHFAAYAGANTLRNQHQSRATARGVTGLNTTTRRGGSSQLHFVKSVAGQPQTYALPSNVAGGRGNVQLVHVQSVHHFGLHKVVVSKQVAASKTRSRGSV